MSIVTGRLNRRSFLIQSTLLSLVSLVLEGLILYTIKDTYSVDEVGQLQILPTSVSQDIVMYIIYSVFLTIVIWLIVITIKRGHDIGMNGWVSSLLFLTGFGLLYLAYKKGAQAENKYNPGYKLTPETIEKQFGAPSREDKIAQLEQEVAALKNS